MTSHSNDMILEEKLIGKILLYPYEIQEALDLGLKAEHFSDFRLGELFKEMVSVYLENSKIDITSLSWDYEELCNFIEENEITYTELAVKKIIENYRARVLEKEIQKILISREKSEDKIQKILKTVEKVEEISFSKNRSYSPSEMIEDFMDKLGKPREIIKYPFSQIHELLTIEKESLVTVGARPSMGKTSFGLNLAYRLSGGYKVMYVNIEMGKEQIRDRIISIESGIPYKRIERGEWTTDEKKLINLALNAYNSKRLEIYDAQDPSFKKIVNDIRKSHQKEKLTLVVIDYLTLLRDEGHQSKNYEVEHMANTLKMLAKELGICIVTLAQLNRTVEGRPDKRPVMSDLRDSGGIEQASNVVAFLHREDYYKPELRKGGMSEIEFIVRKNRNGELGTAYLGFDLKTQKIALK